MVQLGYSPSFPLKVCGVRRVIFTGVVFASPSPDSGLSLPKDISGGMELTLGQGTKLPAGHPASLPSRVLVLFLLWVHQLLLSIQLDSVGTVRWVPVSDGSFAHTRLETSHTLLT